MSTPLQGKKALVTGATRGIGHAIAQRLLADGADVHGTGTTPGGEVPQGCHFHAVDFTDDTALHAFSETVRRENFDILINNAGINKIAPFAEIDPEDFARIQKVNVHAPFMLIRATLPGMRAKKWGRVVTLSSIWGKIAKEYRGSYATSKFAVDGMTLAAAAEVAADGVLVNCIAPGFIDTELTRRVLGDEGIAELTAGVPAKRLGTPDEIAAFVSWLAGPENTYITGQNIAIDGGFTRV